MLTKAQTAVCDPGPPPMEQKKDGVAKNANDALSMVIFPTFPTLDMYSQFIVQNLQT